MEKQKIRDISQAKNDELDTNEKDPEILGAPQEEEPNQREHSKLVDELTNELEATKDKLLRAIAESENIRHRMNKMIDEARDYSIVNFARDLVPVIDNLSRALDHLPENLDDNSRIIADGVRMTKNELESVFKKHGLESIKPKAGENFDYNHHHAISQVETSEQAEGSVVSTMQIGYKIRDRLLRPASVSVAKTKTA